MDLQQLVIMLVIGAVAGWLAGMIVKKGGLGIVGNIIVGILGAVVSGWLFQQLGIKVGGEAWVNALVTSTAGAVILLFVVGLVKG